MPSQFARCIIFHGDGTNYNLFSNLLTTNKLPNIQKYILKGGSMFDGVTCFPSTTGVGYLPLLIGLLPGEVNIPGIRWFDRHNHNSFSKGGVSYIGVHSRGLNRNPVIIRRNLLNINKRCYAINSIINSRSNNHLNHGVLLLAKIRNNWALADFDTYKKLDKIIKGDFKIVFANFPGIDEHSHSYGLDSPVTIRTYNQIDKYIGKICNTLKNIGKLHDTLLIYTSDHGQSRVNHHFDLAGFCNQFYRTNYFPIPFKSRSNCFVAESGNSMANIYIKKNNRWDHPYSYEDFQEDQRFSRNLLAQNSIQFVLSRDREGLIHIQSKKGEGILRKENSNVTYEYNAHDPIGLEFEGTESVDKSLELSYNHEFPDIYLQVSQIFDSPRCGDLILVARKNYDLRKNYEFPRHKTTHGGLYKQQMKIPILINYRSQTKFVRSVDLYSTIIDKLGIKNNYKTLGKVI